MPDLDRVAEPGVGADQLAEHGSDHGDRDRHLRAREEVRQRGGQLQAAQQRPAARPERAQHLHLRRVDRAQAVERVDDDREEADEGDHDQLRGHAEPEPDHEDRSDHDHRHGLRGDDQRVHARGAASGERCSATAIATPDREREREAEQHLLGRDPGVLEQQARGRRPARGRPRWARAAGSPRPSRRAPRAPSPPRASASSASGGPQSRERARGSRQRLQGPLRAAARTPAR